VTTLEAQTALDVGPPGTFGFSAGNHQYAGTIEPDGTFRDAYLWRAGTPIQLLE
jgi:hypothetical protein